MVQNHEVRNGLILGVVGVVYMMVTYLISPVFMVGWGNLLDIFIFIFFMYKAVSATRLDNNNLITTNDGFRTAWLTYVLGSSIYITCKFLLMNYIDPSLVEVYKETHIGWIEYLGKQSQAPDEQIAPQIELIKESEPFNAAAFAVALPFSFIFPGAFIAFFVGLLMRKSPNSGSKVSTEE
jgi:hypothetical protein